MTVGEKISQLAGYLEEQRQVYLQMFETAKAQRELCQTSDFSQEKDLDELHRLLSLRREQMEQVDSLQDRARPVREELLREVGLQELTLSALSQKSSQVDTTVLREALNRLGSLLEKITALDKKSQAQLEYKLGALGKKINETQTNRKAHEAYGPARRQREGYFVDEKNC